MEFCSHPCMENVLDKAGRVLLVNEKYDLFTPDIQPIVIVLTPHIVKSDSGSSFLRTLAKSAINLN